MKRVFYYLIFAPINIFPRLIKTIWKHKLLVLFGIVFCFICYVVNILIFCSTFSIEQDCSFRWIDLRKEFAHKARTIAQEEEDKKIDSMYKIKKVFLLKNMSLINKPLIVVVIDRLGDNADVLQRALEMPSNVALGFSIYTPHLKNIIQKAHRAGHPVFLDLPMKDFPSEENFYGCAFLSPLDEDHAMEDALEKVFNHLPSVQGVINQGGDFSLRNQKFVKYFLQLIQKKHLIYLMKPKISDDKIHVYNYPYVMNYAYFGNKNVISANFLFSEESGQFDVLKKKANALDSALKKYKFSVVIFDSYPFLISFSEKLFNNRWNLINISSLMKLIHIVASDTRYKP